jgi:hypothetical protein
VDPNGQFGQIVAGALIGAGIAAVAYIGDLIATYGIKKAWNHFSGWKLGWEMIKGAASGALGFGIVEKLSDLGELSWFGSKMLGGHIAPAAYAISAIGNPFGVYGFLESETLSFFSKKANVIYTFAKPMLNYIYNKYKNRRHWWW